LQWNRENETPGFDNAQRRMYNGLIATQCL